MAEGAGGIPFDLWCTRPWGSLVTRPLFHMQPEQSPGPLMSPNNKDGSMTRIAQFTDFVGIDVSKSHLDVFTLPDGEIFRVSNDRRGLWELLSRLSCYDEALVVMEATGALEEEAALLLAESGFHVSVVNPRQVRDFARAIGLLAKTDALDAYAIARFAEAVQPKSRKSAAREHNELKALTARCRQLTSMISHESCRVKLVSSKMIRRRIQEQANRCPTAHRPGR